MHLSKRLSVHVMVALSVMGLVLYGALPAHAVVSSRGKPTPTPTATPTLAPTNTPTPTPVATPTPMTTPIPTPTCTASWHLVSAPTIGTGINQLQAVSGDSASDVWAVGQVNSPNPALIEHWNGSSWSLTPTPDPGGVLHGVAAISPSDVWAVGTGNNGPSLIEHWNGSAWSIVSNPNPGPLNELFGVAAVSSANVWAVGMYTVNSPYQQLTLIEHWNGSSWSVVPSPSPAGAFSQLRAVTAISVTDIWAVGDQSSSTESTLTEHWSGTAWSIVPSPNQGADNQLNGVSAVSSNDVWAVGQLANSGTLTEHWNGTAWSIVASPTPSGTLVVLDSVAAAGPGDVWAVGSYGQLPSAGADQEPLIEHWNGLAWAVVTSPIPQFTGGAEDIGVTVINSTDVWAVGLAGWNTFTENWNGTGWNIVSSPNTGLTSDYLNGVAAVSSNDVWTVGRYAGTPGQALIEHWNGSSWSIISSPGPLGPQASLQAVAAVSANDVWAVGDFSSSDGAPHQTLIEHWNGTAWSVVLSPNATSGENELLSVAAVSSSDVWAVGFSVNPNVLGVTDEATLVEHWNGTSWSIVTSPNVANQGDQLTGIAAASAHDIWAVGISAAGGIQSTLTEHWNGSSWSVVSSPNSSAEDSILSGATVVSSNDVWTVGMAESPDYNGGQIPLALHWNGASWALVGAPASSGGSGDRFDAAVALGTNDVWAVGSTAGGSLTEQWDGSFWHAVSSPTPPTGADLVSVSAAGATDIWAVGAGPVTEHYTCQ